DFEETLGVNSRAQLAQVEAILRKRINAKHMDNGVTLLFGSIKVTPLSICFAFILFLNIAST
ncbi:hypothetical protein H9X77_17365, partial [Clostridium saudiense]|nr:hypothetical protein [Clostridium saudiense]